MGWICYALGDPDDSEITPDYTVGGITSGFTKQYFGWAYNATSVPSKGNPYKVDAIRYGRCDIQVTNGQAGAYGTFAGMAAYNDLNVTTFRRFGLFQAVAGGYLWKGLMSLGTTTAVDFRDSNVAITIQNTKHVTANFNKIEINNASSRVDWTGVAISSLSTQSPGRFEVVDNADVNIDLCTFNDMDTFVFLSSSAATNTTWNRCARVTGGNADLSGSSILESTVIADEGALFWDETIATPTSITDLDNMTFSQGTNAHHAIRFGTGVADDITLTGMEFSGWSGSADDSNDSIFRFDATSGSFDLNLVNCTVDGSPITAVLATIDDAAGATVTPVINPVTTKLTIEDNAGGAIQNARALLETADNGGGTGLPFEAGVSTLTQTAGTATLTASAVHGLATNDYVVIRGAGVEEYNGQKQITVTTTTAFEYSIDSGTTSPAGGTPVFSYAPISGLTSSLGEIQSSKTWPASQGLKGWARKSTSSPLYKQTRISIADASGGTDQLVTLQSDE